MDGYIDRPPDSGTYVALPVYIFEHYLLGAFGCGPLHHVVQLPVVELLSVDLDVVILTHKHAGQSGVMVNFDSH